jgi:transcriptional regulator with XRE-family HTH domain
MRLMLLPIEEQKSRKEQRLHVSTVGRAQEKSLSNLSELKSVGVEDLEPFLDKEYRDSYIDGLVKGRIALQIKALREKAGLSQKEFGSRIGKLQSVVSRLEDTEYGSVSINTLLDIAKALDVALDIKFYDYVDMLLTDLGEEALQVDSIQDTYEAHATGLRSTTTTVNPTTVVFIINPLISITFGSTGAKAISAINSSGGATWRQLTNPQQ